MKKYDIMVAGHLCLDIIPQFPPSQADRIEQILCPGKLVNVNEAFISTGGAVSNTGITMKILGNRVCFSACVGNDHFGRMISQILSEKGITDGIRIIENASSSYSMVIAPPNIDRIFLHNPGTNDLFGPEHVDSALLKDCRHFHFGYPPLMQRMYENDGIELQAVFRKAKQASTSTSCDMTLPDPDSASAKVCWKKILKNILPYIDIFLPSIEEVLYILDPTRFEEMRQSNPDSGVIDNLSSKDLSRIADQLLEMGTKIAALKIGHRGFYVKTSDRNALLRMNAPHLDMENWSDRQLWTPAFKVDNFGSATGSGDCAISGFLSAYLRGEKIEKTLKYAACCGWQNIQVLDGVNGIRSWEKTTEILTQDIALLDADLSGSKDWSWSEDNNLWAGPGDRLNQ